MVEPQKLRVVGWVFLRVKFQYKTEKFCELFFYHGLNNIKICNFIGSQLFS
jgi:hypothetical protein